MANAPPNGEIRQTRGPGFPARTGCDPTPSSVWRSPRAPCTLSKGSGVLPTTPPDPLAEFDCPISPSWPCGPPAEHEKAGTYVGTQGRPDPLFSKQLSYHFFSRVPGLPVEVGPIVEPPGVVTLGGAPAVVGKTAPSASFERRERAVAQS